MLSQKCDPTLSIICVYNDEEILGKYLLASLENQTVPYDLRLVDNTGGRFKSAASALNYGASNALGKYLMFAHQDVSLGSKSCVEDIERTLDRLPNVGIAGAAGKKDRGGFLTNITDGEPAKHAGGTRRIGVDEPVKVQTLDECLFIVPKSVFSGLRFDEDSCNGWHLYAVDYSLSVQERDLDVYVLPIMAHHRSQGRLKSKDYFTTLGKLFKKHNKSNSWIYTSMGDWQTARPALYYRVLHEMSTRFRRLQS